MAPKLQITLEHVNNGDRMVWEAVIETSGYCFDQGEHQAAFDTKAQANRAIKSVMACACTDCTEAAR
jgi:hypothetical protein